jgi:hypothetical protein
MLAKAKDGHANIAKNGHANSNLTHLIELYSNQCFAHPDPYGFGLPGSGTRSLTISSSKNSKKNLDL